MVTHVASTYILFTFYLEFILSANRRLSVMGVARQTVMSTIVVGYCSAATSGATNKIFK